MMRASIVLLATILTVVGCRLADVRPDSVADGVSEAESAEGRRIIDDAVRVVGGEAFQETTRLRATVEDVWDSWLVRQFTPIPRARQRLVVEMNRESGSILARLLDDTGRVAVLDVTRGSDHRIYLESLRLYMELPFQPPEYVADGGESTLGDRRFRHVYGSPAGFGLDERDDQYLYWIDESTGRVAFVEFTYREVMGSYRGTLAYDDWRRVGNLSFPHRIRIQDRPGDDDVVHEFVFETVELER